MTIKINAACGLPAYLRDACALKTSAACARTVNPIYPERITNRARAGKKCSGGSKGGTRDARPPGGPNSFIFMQFSAKTIG